VFQNAKLSISSSMFQISSKAYIDGCAKKDSDPKKSSAKKYFSEKYFWLKIFSTKTFFQLKIL